jgi:hypothetical protein
MPNIKIKSGVDKQDVHDFMQEVSRQLKEQTGREYSWSVEEGARCMNLHYNIEDLPLELQSKEAVARRNTFGKGFLAAKGQQAGIAMEYGRGAIKKALKVFMHSRGKRIVFEGWF